MIRPVMRDPLFLARPSLPADEADAGIADDLLDTLGANLERCVGMAANMVGGTKRIIAVCCGPGRVAMINPRIIAKSGPYEAEEGCLSLPGVRKARRYRKITIAYLDRAFRPQTGTFEGFTAQIIQHEIDHCDGILI